MILMTKLERIRLFMEAEGCDAILVSSDENRRYVANFSGTTGYAFVTKTNNYFLTDFRYFEQVEKQCTGFELVKITKDNTYYDALNAIIAKEGLAVVGLEGNTLSYVNWQAFEKNLNAKLEVIDLINLRAVKNDEEIALVTKACDIAVEAFNELLKEIKVGMSEVEVKNLLDSKMKNLGASAASFDMIVASGARGALPHGVASTKLIEANDFVTIDYGCFYEGYCSDITRTFAMGKDYNPKIAEIYQIVKEANMMCIEAVKPGVTCKQLDDMARNYISEKGYGEYFGHGLGHGIGLEIHEEPRVNWTCDTVLEPGMIITIEPGIYLPGIGGVRLEDDILVTETGYKCLTNLSKELLVLAD